jgi:HK97 family phage prohead protease
MPLKEYLNKEMACFAYVKDDKAAINEEQRRIRFVISTDQIDRDNERIEVKAIADAIKGFARNPTALACHQHRLATGSSPVVGSWDTNSFNALKHHCEMDLVFATTALGEEYWQLYKDKHMRAVSIGFRVIDGHDQVIGGKNVFVITKIELYEISCVPVPANPGALSKLKKLDWWSNEPVDQKALSELIADQIKEVVSGDLNPILSRIEDSLDEVKDMFCYPDGRPTDHTLGDPARTSSVDGEANITSEHVLTAVKSLLNSD